MLLRIIVSAHSAAIQSAHASKTCAHDLGHAMRRDIERSAAVSTRVALDRIFPLLILNVERLAQIPHQRQQVPLIGLVAVVAIGFKDPQ